MFCWVIHFVLKSFLNPSLLKPNSLFNAVQSSNIHYTLEQPRLIQYNTEQLGTFSTIQNNSALSVQFITVRYKSVQRYITQYTYNNPAQSWIVQYPTIYYKPSILQYFLKQSSTLQYTPVYFGALQYNPVRFNQMQFHPVQCSSLFLA